MIKFTFVHYHFSVASNTWSAVTILPRTTIQNIRYLWQIDRSLMSDRVWLESRKTPRRRSWSQRRAPLLRDSILLTVSREYRLRHGRRTGVRGRGEGRRRRCIQLNSATRPLTRGRTLTPLAPACARHGIMIHNRSEFTQPRVKTHWELGVARGPECSARPEDGCAVRASSKNHEVSYTSHHAIGCTIVELRVAPPTPHDQSARSGERRRVRPP